MNICSGLPEHRIAKGVHLTISRFGEKIKKGRTAGITDQDLKTEEKK